MDIPGELTQLVLGSEDILKEHLRTSPKQWLQMIQRLERVRVNRAGVQVGEKVWTFLVAAGYAAAGRAGVTQLTTQLAGDLPAPDDPAIWFEALPPSPRQKESNTELDLAVGHITRRDKGGIDLVAGPGSWVCFVDHSGRGNRLEAKGSEQSPFGRTRLRRRCGDGCTSGTTSPTVTPWCASVDECS